LKASRPFDRSRDGLVPSGGAATVILESLESAQKRGATILGEVIGYGFSSNGEHISNPTVNGPVRSLQMALKDAGLTARRNRLYKCALPLPPRQVMQARLKLSMKFLRRKKPYVSSTKSMTGHECWMAGASEIVYSMLMMQNSFIAPNINFENPDEDSARINIVKTTLEENIDVFLSNSFGFGGTNSSIIVKKY
jgi:3-oxoacyl-[acyl-carrier-protein] synthase-1